ncbi:MAG: efflux RND transporter periplasmic adaptor subunit [Candidatus Krumholzibacteria bacterium]|nr:efflux RND transporter periplasmic adaptor subunit [Candidatus Krumholzibacteria bacterium]
MNRCISLIFILIALGIMSTTGSCGGNGHSEPVKEEDKLVVPVEVDIVSIGDIAAYFTGTATIEAEEETEVVAKVSGTVEEIMVEEGEFVKSGQILAKLDDEMISVQLKQAEANLRKMESNFERNKNLHEKNLISTEIYQQTKYEYEQQKASYDMARLNLDYTEIRTPISGIVSIRLIKKGNMILQNQSTFKVSGFDPLIAVLYVPERQLAKLRTGLLARLSVDAIEDREIDGHIERISPIVDPATGTVKVTIETNDSLGRLRPGMFARIKIIYDVHVGALKIPKDAIISEDRESAVFVVQDSVAYRRSISLGYINTTHVEVLEGLAHEDVIVTTGKGSLRDSTRVEIVKQ